MDATGTATRSRTQDQRREATTRALLDAARALFARDGYATTSLDAVVARAGVTKGALYHHFDGKRELFEAVFAAELERLTGELVAAFGRAADPWEGLRAACRSFLDATTEPALRQIVLVDSFGALGFAAVREAEAPLLGALREALRLSMDAGRLPRRAPEPLAALLFGGLCEAALTTARADDERATHRAVAAELDRLLDALAAG
ncbi:MAG: TetR/AcrR family transcriptional regulator [Solirubrobacterales bacterium]|nr:TetR/AcrR family transcriptional regulator [Solirubrobacterales bacterium]